MKAIGIGKRLIGGNAPCYIIAEIGLNHNGSTRLAKKMIAAAKKAGADAVKIQAYKTESLAGEKDRSAFKTFKRAELNQAQFRQLKRFADKKKIDFFASVFDFQSADAMEHVGVKCFKIASGELTNTPLLLHIASKGKPLLLSTGMATESEIKEALKAIFSTGNRKVVLLHCIAEYPAMPQKLNLKKIPLLEKRFGLATGFSDHSLGITAGIAAVPLGAKVLEKHFTIDKKMPGPDQWLSIDPEELKQLVAAVRLTEKALGKAGFSVVEPKKQIIAARKSLFAAKEILAGEKIAAKKIALRRPAIGILPKDFNKVLGKKAKAKIKAGQAITWRMVQK
jgi:sialic acid synthase SpsE